MFSDPWELPAKVAVRCNIFNAIPSNAENRDEKDTKPLRSNHGTTGFASITRAIKHTSNTVERNVVASGDRCRRVNTCLAEAGVTDVILALGRRTSWVVIIQSQRSLRSGAITHLGRISRWRLSSLRARLLSNVYNLCDVVYWKHGC
jgi:hypothetical protein